MKDSPALMLELPEGRTIVLPVGNSRSLSLGDLMAPRGVKTPRRMMCLPGELKLPVLLEGTAEPDRQVCLVELPAQVAGMVEP